MLKKRRTAITVYDSNGKTITDETKRNRLGEMLGRFLTMLRVLLTALILSVRTKWGKLAIIPKKKCEDKEAEICRAYTDSRDEIAAAAVFGILAASFMISGKLPFILGVTGIFETILVIAEALARRDAIRDRKKLKKMEKRLYKGTSRAMKAFMTLVLCLTVFAWAITAGKMDSVSETFPMLQKFAEWQVNQVNELLEFFDKLVHGQI